MTFEQDQLDAVRVMGGFNPFDFGYVLHPGQSLETPIFYGGYSSHGLGGASRLLHRFEISQILPRKVGTGPTAAPKPRPVIYNSWEATEMNVTEAGQMALAEKAAASRRRSLRHGRRLVWAAQRRIMQALATGM